MNPISLFQSRSGSGVRAPSGGTKRIFSGPAWLPGSIWSTGTSSEKNPGFSCFWTMLFIRDGRRLKAAYGEPRGAMDSDCALEQGWASWGSTMDWAMETGSCKARCMSAWSMNFEVSFYNIGRGAVYHQNHLAWYSLFFLPLPNHGGENPRGVVFMGTKVFGTRGGG